MKFTVREVGLNSVTVDFEDGSWAEVPYSDGLKSKADLLRLIDTYSNKLNTLPAEFVTAGEELDSEVITGEDEQLSDDPEKTLLDWKQLRQQVYPTRGDQLDALYKARKGDPSELQEIDVANEEVKPHIPKDFPPMTRDQFAEYLLKT